MSSIKRQRLRRLLDLVTSDVFSNVLICHTSSEDPDDEIIEQVAAAILAVLGKRLPLPCVSRWAQFARCARRVLAGLLVCKALTHLCGDSVGGDEISDDEDVDPGGVTRIGRRSQRTWPKRFA